MSISSSGSGIHILPQQGMVSESVRLYTGDISRSIVLALLPTLGGNLAFNISYCLQDEFFGPVGHKWRHGYEAKIEPGPTLVVVYSGGGQRLDFIADGLGGWVLDISTSYHTTHELTNSVGNIWELKSVPEGTIWRFDEDPLVGYPATAGRLTEVEDRHGNVLTLNYSSGKLASLEESEGRQVLLGYTGDLITSVTDPRSEVTYLTYDGLDNLVSVSGPEGCTVSFAHANPGTHVITATTDSRGNTRRYEHQGNQIGRVVEADGTATSFAYFRGGDAPLEYTGDSVTAAFEATRVTQPDGQVFEYRFDDSGSLWRTISPSGHVQRFFWSPQHRLLYSSEGFPLLRNGLYGPADNQNNRYTRHTVTAEGHVIATIESDGLVNTFEYDSEGRMLISHPGQAHLGVQGDWPPYYGSEGVILCAFNSDDSDVYRAPDYMDASLATAITNGDGSGNDLFVRDNLNTVGGIIDPRAPVLGEGSIKASVGHWKQTGSLALGAHFQFAINLTESKAFNLSLYSHSADHAKMDLDPMEYYEQFGRDVTVEVEDIHGVQSYRMINNAPGIWVTFPVEGDDTNPIRVTVTASGNNNQPVLSAIAFDPHHDRRTFYEYTGGDLTTVRDSLGNETLYAYNPDGTVASVTDARGKVTSFAYLDAYKQLTKITDDEGNETVMTRDENGNALTVTDANLNVTTMTYDGKGRLLTVTDALSNLASEMEYDANGNVLSVTDAKLRQTLFSYDELNRLIEVVNPAGDTMRMAYDSRGRLASQVDARGLETRYSYTPEGLLAKVTTPDGQRSTMSYDAVNQLVALTSPNGNQEALDLINLVSARNLLKNPGFENVDPNRADSPDHWNQSNGVDDIETGEVHSGQASLALTPQVSWSQSQLDLPEGAAFVAKAMVKRDPFSVVLEAQVRNLQGAAVSQTHSEPIDDKFDDWASTERFRLTVPGDAQSSITNPTGVQFAARVSSPNSLAGWIDDVELYMLSQAYHYNQKGALKTVTTPDGAKLSLHRDRLGRVTSYEDARGLRTELVYDVRDRVTSLSKPSGETLEFAYNELGALISFTDGRNQEIAFAYDDLNRLATITYPDTSTEVFTYDPVGNLDSYTDNASQVFGFAYDELNRLETITYPDTTTVVMTYDEVGNLLTLTERNGDVTEYDYDVLDRVISVIRTKDGGNSTPEWELHHEYDANGNRVRLSDGAGELWRTAGAEARYHTARYGQASYNGGYDGMDRPLGIAKGATVHTEFRYDPEGRRTAVEMANGARTDVSFDIMGRPMAISTSNASGSLLTSSYGYDIASNRTRQVTGTDTFDYRIDDDGKLVGEAVNRMVVAGSRDFARGSLEKVGLTGETVELLSLNDSFAGDELDCDRWLLAYFNYEGEHPDLVTGCEVRVNNGAHFRVPRGYSNRIFYRTAQHPVSDNYGVTGQQFTCALEHRSQLTGNFDVRVELHDPQVNNINSLAGIYVANRPLQDHDLGAWIRAEYTGTGQIMVRSNVGTTSSMTAPPLPTILRAVRTGSSVTISAWNSSTSTWQTQAGWVRSFTSDPATPGLSITVDDGSIATATFKNFVFDAAASLTHAPDGTFTSGVYDAGRNVAWDSVRWQETLPGSTDMELQLAFADSPDGPWSYRGPDGTAGSYFTTASGHSVGPSVISRYCRAKAYLEGNGTATPILESLDISYSGSLSSAFESFAFDEAGNLTEKVRRTDASAVTETRTYDNLNQIVDNEIDDGSPVTWDFTHDTNGNMTSRTDGTDTYDYIWDDQNRLVGVELNSSPVVSYEYDSASRMIQRVEGGTTTNYHWDGWDLIREEKAGVINETTNYLVPFGEVLAFERGGDWFYLHGDALSSTQLVTDENGDQVGRFIYGAWGEELYASESVPGILENRFVGGLGCRRDVATGLIYMRHRWYDASLQRFISRDPIGHGMDFYRGYPVSQKSAQLSIARMSLEPNTYVYTANCPTQFVDPRGLLLVCEIAYELCMEKNQKIYEYDQQDITKEKGLAREYFFSKAYDSTYFSMWTLLILEEAAKSEAKLHKNNLWCLMAYEFCETCPTL